MLDRLRQAAMDRQILDQMEIEDEVLMAWKQRERVNEKTLAEAQAREEDERRRKEEALAALAQLQEELAGQKNAALTLEPIPDPEILCADESSVVSCILRS